ncbi:MAG TPA: ElyC/SanA/YdcF family protein [Victivallales bacterium]|nr:ElyC/SanA/YdcF family protein [Victivallales bacterium]
MKKKLLLGLIVSTAFATLLLFNTGCSKTYTASTQAKVQNRSIYNNQAEVEELIQNAIYLYWHGGDIKKAEKKYFKGITLRGNYDAVQKLFEKASALAPYRLDLMYDIASTQILQGNLNGALNTYTAILNKAPNEYNASLLFAVYNKLNGNNKLCKHILSKLTASAPIKTKNYSKAISRTENNLRMTFTVKAEKLNLKNHIIVVLGYALAKNGTPQPTMIGRLKQTLSLYKLNPHSKIITSGGMAEGGVTEAYVMKEWLVKNNVPENMIIMDDNSKDTVGNAVDCARLLKSERAENMTLISSASHMRRAMSCFQEACIKENLKLNYTNLVYMDYPSLKQAYKVTKEEKLVIFRDLLRTSGIWAYPGIQQ